MWAIEKLRTSGHTFKKEAFEKYKAKQQQQISSGPNSAGAGEAKKSKKKKKSAGKDKQAVGDAVEGSTAVAGPSSSTTPAVTVKESEADEVTVDPGVTAITAEELVIRARAQICKGQFRHMVACLKLGYVEKVENEFTTWSWRFEQRFSAFLAIPNPPSLSFEDFLRTLEQISGDPSPLSGSAEDGAAPERDSTSIDISSLPAPDAILNEAISAYTFARKYIGIFLGALYICWLFVLVCR